MAYRPDVVGLHGVSAEARREKKIGRSSEIRIGAKPLRYFDRGVIDHASRVTSPGAWLGRSANDGAIASIVEHPTIVPELGAVFSLLWVPPDAPAPVAPAA
jgi:hypothetical protein